MILSAQSIRARHYRRPLIKPFFESGQIAHGMTFGLDSAGYDVRLQQGVTLEPMGGALGVLLEWIDVPHDLYVEVKDKSSWARKFVFVGNTKVNPGWFGHLTIEITNHTDKRIEIEDGAPIATLVFFRLDEPTDLPYTGRYQNQPPEPVPAIVARHRPIANQTSERSDVVTHFRRRARR